MSNLYQFSFQAGGWCRQGLLGISRQKPAYPQNPGGTNVQRLGGAQSVAGHHGASSACLSGLSGVHLKVSQILRCLALRVVPILWALPVRPALQGFHFAHVIQPEHKRGTGFTARTLLAAPGSAACWPPPSNHSFFYSALRAFTLRKGHFSSSSDSNQGYQRSPPEVVTY